MRRDMADSIGRAQIEPHRLLHPAGFVFKRLDSLDAQADTLGTVFRLNSNHHRLAAFQKIAILRQPFRKQHRFKLAARI